MVAHDVTAKHGLEISLKIFEFGNVTVLCSQSLEEYRSDRGKPPNSAASLILISAEPRARLPRLIQPNHEPSSSSSFSLSTILLVVVELNRLNTEKIVFLCPTSVLLFVSRANRFIVSDVTAYNGDGRTVNNGECTYALATAGIILLLLLLLQEQYW